MGNKAKKTGRLSRSFATAAVIVLLAGQLLAAAHVHPTSAVTSISSDAFGAADGVCAVCLFHFHAPAASQAVPAVAGLANLCRLGLLPGVQSPVWNEIRIGQGRSPPVVL